MTYHKRIIDDLLQDFAPNPVAMLLEGAKGVGKTTSAMQHAVTVYDLEDANQRQTLSANPEKFLQDPGPVLLDEWQNIPALWDLLRKSLRNRTGKALLLTGSFEDTTGVRSVLHLAQIYAVPMRPLSFFERDPSQATVSLAELIDSGTANVAGETDVKISDYIDEIFRSGLPGIRALSENKRKSALSSYINTVVNTALGKPEQSVRRPDDVHRWMTAYADATGTVTQPGDVAKAANCAGQEKLSRSDADAIHALLLQHFMIDPVPEFANRHNLPNERAKGAKYHLMDPALAVHLLDLNKQDVLSEAMMPVKKSRTMSLAERLFESLVTQSLHTYAWATAARIGHPEAKGKANDVDLLVGRPEGEMVAISIQISETVTDQDVRALNQHQRSSQGKLRARIVITAGSRAYVRPDGIAVIPFALLKP